MLKKSVYGSIFYKLKIANIEVIIGYLLIIYKN